MTLRAETCSLTFSKANGREAQGHSSLVLGQVGSCFVVIAVCFCHMFHSYNDVKDSVVYFFFFYFVQSPLLLPILIFFSPLNHEIQKS